MHRGHQGLLVRHAGQVDALDLALPRIEHHEASARTDPDPAVRHLVHGKHIVEAARPTGEGGEREVLEPACGPGPAAKAAAHRPDPQRPGRSAMQRVGPVAREAVGTTRLVKVPREPSAVGVEPVQAVLRPDPQSPLGVLGDAVDALVAQRAVIGGVVVELCERAQPRVPPIEPTGVGRDPQRAVGTLVEGPHVDVADLPRALGVRQEDAGLVAVVTKQPLARSDPQQAVAVHEHGDRHAGVEAAADAEFREPPRSLGSEADRRQQQRHEGRDPRHRRPVLDSSTAMGRVPGNSENTMVRIAVIGTARNAPGTPHSSDHTARLTRMAKGLRLSELPIR